MAFWSETAIEPKRQFRFKVDFPMLDGTVGNSQYLAQYADRPTYTIKGDTAVHFLDKQFMFPGKVTWNTVKIRFVDAITDVNVARKTWDYLSSAGWINPETQSGLNTARNWSTVSKVGSVLGTRGDVRVIVLNTSGGAVDTWTLKNAFINTATLNNLDYAQDGILTAEYTFIYDWAEYT